MTKSSSGTPESIEGPTTKVLERKDNCWFYDSHPGPVGRTEERGISFKRRISEKPERRWVSVDILQVGKRDSHLQSE